MNMEEVEKIIKGGQAEDKMPRLNKKIEIEGKEIVNPPIKSAGKQPAFETPKAKGKLLPLKKGGEVSSASKRADGIAQRGKTKGRFV